MGNEGTPERKRPGAGPKTKPLQGIAPRNQSGAKGSHWVRRVPDTAEETTRSERATHWGSEKRDPFRALARGGARASLSRWERELDAGRVRTHRPSPLGTASRSPGRGRGGASLAAPGRSGRRQSAARGWQRRSAAGSASLRLQKTPDPGRYPSQTHLRGARRLRCFPPEEVRLTALRSRLATSPPAGRAAAAPGAWLRRAAAWRRCACRC